VIDILTGLEKKLTVSLKA